MLPWFSLILGFITGDNNRYHQSFFRSVQARSITDNGLRRSVLREEFQEASLKRQTRKQTLIHRHSFINIPSKKQAKQKMLYLTKTTAAASRPPLTNPTPARFRNTKSSWWTSKQHLNYLIGEIRTIRTEYAKPLPSKIQIVPHCGSCHR